ncbi:hypothetical protein Rhopal_007477-T1 [Rhodotorula paludigena]|uniref:Uncharacterized protein n=1 Tax=Rhodotorula paludigena TaxID=86838 RepID=A0AAV5GXZ6_9BASI|nr:hypothetical protein Rhopal_007477-T1 [Rhodotorula paludigena]
MAADPAGARPPAAAASGAPPPAHPAQHPPHPLAAAPYAASYAPPTPAQAYHDPPAPHDGAMLHLAHPAPPAHDLPHPPPHHPLAMGAGAGAQLPGAASLAAQQQASSMPSPGYGLQIDTGRAHHWQGDGRRKSIKLATPGSAEPNTGSFGSWGWPTAPDAALRRASAPTMSDDRAAAANAEHAAAASAGFGASAGGAHGAMYPQAGSSWPPPPPAASHFYPSLPNPFTGIPSGPPGSSGGPGDARPNSSPSPFSGSFAGAGGPQPAYVPYGAPAYLPYTPQNSSFPPSAYTPMFSHSSPAQPAPYASTSAQTFSSSAYPQSFSYLPTPRTQFPPTPTIPPQATLAYAAPNGLGVETPTSPTFPADPSSPYIPPDPNAPPSQAVLVAAANRTKLGTIDLTGHSKTDEGAARRPSTAVSTRRAVDLEYDCQNCRRKIGRLTLRGGPVEKPLGDNASKYLGVFYCTSCVAAPPSSSSGRPDGSLSNPINAYAGEATYYDQLSAAVDRYQGIDPKTQDTRPPPAAPGKVRSGFTSHAVIAGSNKKRRASVVDESEGVLACDVCRRDLATGSLQLVATGEAVGATIEVLCPHCESRYTRCSDCGGGGGSKGDIWPVSQLPTEQLPELVEMCRDLYYTNLLGTLAVPDMLESVSPIARSFAEIEKLCVDSWTTYEPLISDDIEATKGTRRYVALRWVRPTSRKKRNRKKNNASHDSNGTSDAAAQAGAGQSSPDEPKAQLPPSPLVESPKSDVKLIREGKVLTGFILAELDLEWGMLYVTITLPTGAGESYDASTRLMQTLVARVHEDVAAINADRALKQLAPYPPCTTAWTMHMTKRDSRIMSRLETRRGFIPLEDFLIKYPETDKTRFAPHRPTNFPPEFLRGWQVYAKRLTSEDLPPSHQSSYSSTMSSVSTASQQPYQQQPMLNAVGAPSHLTHLSALQGHPQ